MRTRFQIGGYELEADPEATAACYARIRVPGPEACGCADCRNWIAARELLVPSQLRELLASLGVPINGEIEVAETPGQSQPHLYGGWYFVVGKILSGERGHMFNIDGFQLCFESDQSYAVAEFQGQEVCELHFHTEAGEHLSEAERASPPKPKSL